ncbi:MAG: hypothetical protein LBE12_01855 [Planctomycetaceae bacterium]|nr:hypothetical protein [Planctomycetaceae bacterium]
MRNDYHFGSNPLAALSTLNFPLSTIILPFQGEDLFKLKGTSKNIRNAVVSTAHCL